MGPVKKSFNKVAAAFASLFAGGIPTPHHSEVLPDLGLPRPEWVQKIIMAKADAKRLRKSKKFGNLYLPNSKVFNVLIQQYQTK